jgi:general secretion pathway protein D
MRLFFLLLALSCWSALAQPREGCVALRRTARFTAYFERVDLEKLVQIVSDATCRSFLLGETVKGKISIIGPENGQLKLDADQFYAAFLAALDANGFAAVTQGRFTRIIEKPRAKQLGVPLLLEGEAFPAQGELVTRLFRLKHVEAEVLRSVLSGFLSQGGELLTVPPDVLVVTDLDPNQQRVAALVRQLDVERPPSDVTKLVVVKHAAAAELLDKVQRVLAQRPGGKPVDALLAVADERTNRLLLSGARAVVERAEQLVEQLDLSVPSDSRVRVYRLKNADAKEVATALEAMTQNKVRQPGAPATGTTNGEVRISVSESLNALLVVSSAGDYRELRKVIEELDQPVRQVFIETLILEVNLQRDAQFGVSGHTVGGTTDGTSYLAGSQPTGGASSLSLGSLASSGGLLFGLQGPVLAQVSKLLGISLGQFGLTVQASQTNSDVNVLSMPHILTADNKEAEIAVGQRVPFQLGTNQSQLATLLASGNTSAANLSALTGSISREKVELKLTVKPHIGDGDDIRLEINQQAEELAGTTSSAGPITSTRNQRTTVVAKNEETLVLGGIMQDRDIDLISKVPFLGDIPILGQLFRSTSKKRTKVNLLVFLTPHIIRDASDFRRIVERKMKERARVVEETQSERAEPERTIDFERKRGPLAAIAQALAREQRRPEHGGDGEATDLRVEPTTLNPPLPQ